MPRARRKPWRPALPEGWDTGPDTPAQWAGAKLRPVRGTRGGQAIKVREHVIDGMLRGGQIDAEMHNKAEHVIDAFLMQFLTPSSHLRVDRSASADEATVQQVDWMLRYSRMVSSVPIRSARVFRWVIELNLPLTAMIREFDRNIPEHAAHFAVLLERFREAIDAIDIDKRV